MILNQIFDTAIFDTVLTCYRESIGGHPYPTVGAYLRGAAKPHYPVPALLYHHAHDCELCVAMHIYYPNGYYDGSGQ